MHCVVVSTWYSYQQLCSPAAALAAAAVAPLASVINAVIDLKQTDSQRVHVTAAAASSHATTTAPTSAAAVQHTPHTCALLLLLLLLLLLCSSTAAATAATATAAAASAAINDYCCLLLVALVSAWQAHFCTRWARPKAVVQYSITESRRVGTRYAATISVCTISMLVAALLHRFCNHVYYSHHCYTTSKDNTYTSVHSTADQSTDVKRIANVQYG
jgi:hypothetical protein